MQLGRCLNWQGRFLANSTSPNDISLALRSFRLCSAGERKENFCKPRLALVALGQWSFAKKHNMLNWQRLIIPKRRVESSHACVGQGTIYFWRNRRSVSLVRIVDVQHHSTESGPMLQPCRGTNSGYIVYISYTSAIPYYCFYMWHVQKTHRYVMLFFHIDLSNQPRFQPFFPLVSLPLLIQPLSQLKDQVGWAPAQAP